MLNKLGFGFLRLPQAGDDYDWDAVDRMVDCFMAGGGTYFDTCYTYLDGNSEEGIRRCVAARKPRESFQLADKLPGYKCKSYDDCQTFFEEELTRCGVEYFDVFMLHCLDHKNYATAQKLDEFRFLREKKAEGKAKRIGFSFHDRADLLDRILIEHPETDVVLLQLNYLDWDTPGIESRKCYETCVRHGKRVMAMEPLKGGMLADLPEEAMTLLRAVHPDWSAADWGLRFVQSLPQVEVCLSGMNELHQVEENIRTFTPLTEEDNALLQEAAKIIEAQTAVACTACRYCVPHCPAHLPIPEYFHLLNAVARCPKDDWRIRPGYLQLTEQHAKASDCLACHACEQHCPQHLTIAEHMQKAAAMFEKEKPEE